MKKIEITGKEYTLEYSFMAVEHRETIQKMFNVLSGAYLLKKVGVPNGEDMSEEKEKELTNAMLDGSVEMLSDIPHIVKTTFYSGLLENHGLSEEESYKLMKEYMKEKKISFKKLFDDIKECMEDDGFFDLSGLTEMLSEMMQGTEETEKKEPKTPQDHKKKSTGTK